MTEDAEEAATGGAAAAAAAAATVNGAAAQQAEQQAEQQPQPQQAAEQQGQQDQQAAEACNGSEAGPLAEQEVGSVQLGLRARGVGSRGERYRIHYMTIGPVEGFGG